MARRKHIEPTSARRKKTRSRTADPYHDLLSVRLAFFLAAPCWLLVAITAATSFGRRLEKAVIRPVEYSLRHATGNGPVLASRLKIFALDDASANALKDDHLSLAAWMDLFKNVAARKPAVILVDDTFSAPPFQKAARAFVAGLAGAHPPIVVGALITEEPVFGRPLFNFERADYDLATWLPAGESSFAPLDWLSVDQSYPYGPHPAIAPAFNHVGHIGYRGNADVQAMVRLTHQYVLPHLALFAAKDRQLLDGKLFLDHKEVPLDGDGNLLVDLFTETELAQSGMHPLSNLMTAAASPTPATVINEGDVVLVIPRLSTGHRDWVNTPLGRQPEPMVVASVVNSVLTGRWLTPLGGTALFIALAAALGAILAFSFRPLYFVPTFLLLLGAWPAVGCSAFVAWGYQVPWVYPMVAMAMAGSLIAAEKARRASGVRNRIKYTLAGTVAPARLEQVLANPRLLSLEPTDIVATVMIVDIVGFSFLADTRPPAEVYASLRGFLAELTQLIHSFGGVVDKTMGDGILCFFGYDFGTPAPRHADQAIACALSIQELILARNITAIEQEAPVFPLRIGLNTGGVYFGDLGSSRRHEPTIIGSGVNYAQRLEAACDPYCIMLGATTKDQITDVPPGCAIKKRLIKVKHHDEPLEAYEVDPLATRGELRRRANEGYNRYANIKRKDYRWPVPSHMPITFSSEHGQGSLVDFSRTGFAVTLTEYLGKGLRINITLDSEDTRLAQELISKGIKELLCEVRWGRPYGNAFIHGLQIENLSVGQRQFLLEILRAHIRSHGDKDVA